jgi:hypothetical protein
VTPPVFPGKLPGCIIFFFSFGTANQSKRKRKCLPMLIILFTPYIDNILDGSNYNMYVGSKYGSFREREKIMAI